MKLLVVSVLALLWSNVFLMQFRKNRPGMFPRNRKQKRLPGRKLPGCYRLKYLPMILIKLFRFMGFEI